MGASPEGAEMTTFFAPPAMCLPAASLEVKTPVDSTCAAAQPHDDGSHAVTEEDVTIRWVRAHHKVRTASAPRDRARVLLSGDLDLLAVDNDAVVTR